MTKQCIYYYYHSIQSGIGIYVTHMIRDTNDIVLLHNIIHSCGNDSTTIEEEDCGFNYLW